MKLKRISVFWLVIIVILSLIPTNAFADNPSGTFGRGTWDEDYQGMRFSIYDLETAKTVSVVDMFDEQAWNKYAALRNKPEFKKCVGCKLDYLEQLNHLSGSNSEKVVDVKLRELQDNSQIVKSLNVTIPEMKKFVRPIVMVNASNWTAPQYVKDLLIGMDAAKIDGWILNQLGFYAFNSFAGTNLQYFSDNYVLVAEPVYYFPLYKVSDDSIMYFFGTATEYAIYASQLCKSNIAVSTHSYTGTIHSTMGPLTFFAGPASVLTPETRTFELGTGGSVTIEKSPNPVELYNKYYLQDKGLWDADVAMDIIKYYGVDTLQMNEIKPLTLNISRANTSFHSNTDVYLSFILSNGGDEAMVRDVDEAYEFKLVLETLPESEIQFGNVVMTSEGLPGMTDFTPVSTYIYKKYRLPDKEGKWRFKARLYQTSGEELLPIYYDTDNGFPIEGDDAFGFEIDISRLEYTPYQNPAAGDLMPKNFTPPTAGELEGSLRSVTHREWHYYRVLYRKNGEETEQEIQLVNKTANAEIIADDAVCAPPNIPDRTDKTTGLRLLRSGYGLGVYLPLSGLSGNYKDGFCGGTAIYPEAMFGESCKIEFENGVYKLEKNPYSMYYSDALNSDNSRVHFTPVWYPDGVYPVVVYLFDNWTPAGELSDFKVYTVIMSGTVYDDWYISRN